MTIQDILTKQPGRLIELYSHTADLAILQKKLCSYLPDSLNEHVIVANYNHHTLHLHTDNSAWATKLRFRIPEILDIARNKCELSDIQTVRIRVSPIENNPHNPRKGSKLSSQAANLLADTGNSIDDPDLSAALLRLSRNRSD